MRGDVHVRICEGLDSLPFCQVRSKKKMPFKSKEKRNPKQVLGDFE